MTRAVRAAAPGGGRARLWTVQFVTAMVVQSLTMVVFFLLMTTMALYATQRFAAADTLAGLASSMFVIGAVAARLVAGRLVGAVGPRRVLVYSLAVFIAMSLAYLVAGELVVLLAVRLVHGVAFGLANTAVNTIAQSIIPPDRRGEGTGYFGLSIPIATALGPLVGLALIDRWGYDMLFGAAVVASTAAFGVCLLLTERPLAGPGPPARGFIDLDTLPLASVMLAVGVVNSAMITFTHPFTDAIGLSAYAGAFFGCNALGVLASRLFTGVLQDRLGDNWVMYPALLVYAAGLALLSQADGVGGLLTAATVIGMGFGTIMPTAQAAAVRLAQPQRLGLTVATYFLMLDLGTGIGPLLLGGLVSTWDHRVMYLAVCGLLVVTALHYHLVHGRRAGRRQRS